MLRPIGNLAVNPSAPQSQGNFSTMIEQRYEITASGRNIRVREECHCPYTVPYQLAYCKIKI